MFHWKKLIAVLCACVLVTACAGAFAEDYTASAPGMGGDVPVTVSYEEVLARNPDVILIHDYDSPSVEEKIAEIKGISESEAEKITFENTCELYGLEGIKNA